MGVTTLVLMVRLVVAIQQGLVEQRRQEEEQEHLQEDIVMEVLNNKLELELKVAAKLPFS